MGGTKRSLDSPSASSTKSKRQKMDIDLAPLPAGELALALPGLLTRPSTHPQHATGLTLSRTALRNLLSSSSHLSTEQQTRAWLSLAELSIQSLPLFTPASTPASRRLFHLSNLLFARATEIEHYTTSIT